MRVKHSEITGAPSLSKRAGMLSSPVALFVFSFFNIVNNFRSYWTSLEGLFLKGASELSNGDCCHWQDIDDP